MSGQQHETNAGYEERRRRRQQAATHARTQAQAGTQNPGRAQLSQILTTRRQEIGRTVVEVFNGGYYSIGIRSQMNVVNFDGRELVLQFDDLAELCDGDGNTLASTGLEVTTRETIGEEEDDDDDESFVANSSTSGGDRSNASSSSASDQGYEGDIGDSDAESDSEQETYREEIQGRPTSINFSYEGTLALLRELGGEGGGESTTNPQNFEAQVLRGLEDIAGRSVYQGGTQEDRPLPALYHDNHDDLDATPASAPPPRPEHVYTALRAMDGEWTHVVQHGNISRLGQRRDFSLIDDEAFDAMIDIVHRYRVNPDEVDRNGVADSAAQALREAGVEWTELVDFLRREQRRAAVVS
ncbi:hypothetical protein M409DRAFT_21371 [Zasmidium cellare ATCC 36951]|uniref:Uncharacterized protein n=1 Tax=Zasmidium cellare ATCC 36951 TaxID=1080233 RepID=A0A6A6CT25_ZASCE|nr:uncharacterized protein M409DRAFT_21371 [Zasmidium cellare ATCC 36951]KAF2168626.1 hypothetical protein M409DRAFT_21371 [Zasmidium cellare ATCC 36951]